jgi:hypothetical protein
LLSSVNLSVKAIILSTSKLGQPSKLNGSILAILVSSEGMNPSKSWHIPKASKSIVT